MKRTILAVALLSLTSFCTPALALTDDELVKLQTVMQTHIDTNALNGALLRFDVETKQVSEMFATKAHPKIMTLGKHFVMCADFVDAQGKKLMGNFYIAQEAERFVVFNTTWGDDAALMSLMSSGQLKMAN